MGSRNKKRKMIYIVDNSSSPKIPTDCCGMTTIYDVVRYCEDKPVLGIDTETEGFDFTCKIADRKYDLYAEITEKV